MIKRKIVLRFIVGADEDNNYRYKNVTLRNIRPELSDQQLIAFIIRYCSLTANVLEEAVVVDERHLMIEEEIELIEEELLLDEEDSSVAKEGADISKKGVTTASNQGNEAEVTTLKGEITPITEPVQWLTLGLRKGDSSAQSIGGTNGKNLETKDKEIGHPAKQNQPFPSVALTTNMMKRNPLVVKAQRCIDFVNQGSLFKIAQSIPIKAFMPKLKKKASLDNRKKIVTKTKLRSDFNKQSPPLTLNQHDN